MKKEFEFSLANDYCEHHSTKEPQVLADLRNATEEKYHNAHMVSGPLVRCLIELLFRLHKPKSILELGTYTGYGATTMALLAQDAKITTVDYTDKYLDTAKHFFKAANVEEQINFHMQDALEYITSLEQKETFDFVFVDANKKAYIDTFHAILPLLKPNGLVVFDNMLWYGEVFNPKKIKAKHIAELNEVLANDERIFNIMLPIRDGLQVIQKK